jgi:hypothetical protein
LSKVYTQIFSDNFHRANEQPLNTANWTVNTFDSNLQLAVVSDVCESSSSQLDGIEFFTSLPVASNQFVEAVIGQFVSGLGSAVNLYGRSDLALTNYYYLAVGNSVLQLDVYINSVQNRLALVSMPVINTGDVVRMEMSGSSIIVLYNGVVKISVTNGAVLSGFPGLEIAAAAVQSDTSVTLFKTGGITNSTPGTIYPGIYEGSSLAAAFANPSGFDLMQVINEGGRVVWNLTAAGIASTNPSRPTANSILGKFSGSSFATAFPNPGQLDLIQVVNEGGGIVFGLNYQGYTYTPAEN